MGKRLPNTPRSKIRAALRALSLRCRERADALKREKYTCECCGAKKSTAKGKEVKVEAHHQKGIEWNGVIDIIIERILQTSDDYEVLCKGCHDAKHNGGECEQV